ncbi:tripartite motif-containing protein 2 isoform X2 [Folsomia candida]|uniref:tripartite motif-containing protein 2 isoform X2 n=1 Tax=Folsomia candida TaxID=158441 RepID=UPI001604BD55|nr:tripartite motif-containing protein 2 isoform X2 [Folsomia candida]
MEAFLTNKQISGGSGSSSSRRSSLLTSTPKKRMSADAGGGGPASLSLLLLNNNEIAYLKESNNSIGSGSGGCSSLPPMDTVTRPPLSCSICRDKYKNPKVLPCLHTFCEGCLIDYLPQESLSLTCPECRQQSILPERGVSDLQTNFCVSSLSMELVRGCGYCDKGAASFKCHDCDVDMCATCSKTHPSKQDGKPESSCHQISPLHPVDSNSNENVGMKKDGSSNSLTNTGNKTNGHQDETAAAAGRYLYCPSHAGQTLRFFCRDCDTAVCSSCTDIEHGRHSTIRVLDAVAEEKLRLQQLLDGITEKVKKLEDAVQLAETAAEELASNKVVGEAQISAAFDQLVTRLKERRSNLLDELDLQYNVKLDLIHKSRTVLRNHLKDVQECCLLTEKALSHENETEILFVKKQIGERLEDYAKMEVDHVNIQQQLDHSLEFEHLTIERLDLNGLGRVVSSLHKGWAVSGDVIESRCVPIGRRHFLRLYAPMTPPGGDLCLDDIHVSASTKDVVYSLEQPRESDSRCYIIRFLVSRIGSFNLSVAVKNQHICGSPFQFHAYEGEDRSTNSSPGPFYNGGGTPHGHSVSATASPTGSNSLSRIPRANGASPYSPRSRMSTPTNRFYSNGHISSNKQAAVNNGHHHGSFHAGSSSRRSATLEDDLILKIGSRGRNRGEFTNPQAVAASANGRVVVTDSNNQCIQVFDNTGEFKLRFGVRGRTVGQLQRPVGVAILPTTGNIAVADYDNKWISIFDPNGKFMSRIGHGKLLGPKGITVDGSGLLYVVDNKASAILIFQQNGKLVNKFGSRGNDEGQFAGPHFIAVNSKGNIIVTDFHNHCVKVFDHEGDYLYSFGSNGEGNGQFNAPTGIAVDKNDNILVGDWGNSRIQIFDSQGSFQSYVSTSVEPLYGPQGLTVTPDGYVAIADSGNHCVKLYKYA